MLKKLLLIHPEGNSFNNPSIKSLIDMLCDKGVEITLLHRRTIAPMPIYRNIRYVSWSVGWGRVKNLITNKICSGLLAEYTTKIDLASLKIGQHDLVIGVDREGLIQAYHFYLATKTPYVFLSFEIMYQCETSLRFKRLEIIASRKISTCIVQDERRARDLLRENALEEKKVLYLPLASKGLGEFPTERLRDSLGIGQKKAAILMGSVTGWTMAFEVIKSVERWPKDWCLILHDRYGKSRKEFKKIFGILLEKVENRVYISETASEKIDDIGYILNGIDLGLAFYKPDYSTRYLGENIKNIGLASGKISTFLRYGVPVVMNDIGIYSTFANLYGYGSVIKSPSELPNILDGLDVAKAKMAALKFFTEKLDFQLFEEQVWKNISEI